MAEFGGDAGFAAAPIASEPWDDKYAADGAAATYDAAAPAAGQWTEAAAPGWDQAAPPVAPSMDFAAGAMEYAPHSAY